MGISLIICTRNRERQLEVCLEHVSRLESPPGGWELAVVDSASSDGTPDVIQSFAETAPMNVVTARESRPGLGRARNAGLVIASGEICAFTDDDCYVRPDFLVQLACAFEDPEIAYVGGRVVLHDPLDAPVTLKDIAAAYTVPALQYVPPGVLLGANMAFRRRVMRAIGGFDPLLGSGTGLPVEDLDFIARAAWNGCTGSYDPRPVVAHHHRRKPGQDVVELNRAYAYGRGAYFAKWILNPVTRGLYAREWRARLRARFEAHDRVTLQCELAGAALYLLRRGVSGERSPVLGEHREAPSTV